MEVGHVIRSAAESSVYAQIYVWLPSMEWLLDTPLHSLIE